MGNKIINKDDIDKKTTDDLPVYVCNFPANHYLRVDGNEGTSHLLNLNSSVLVIKDGDLTFFPLKNDTDPKEVLSSSKKGKITIKNWNKKFKVTIY